MENIDEGKLGIHCGTSESVAWDVILNQTTTAKGEGKKKKRNRRLLDGAQNL